MRLGGLNIKVILGLTLVISILLIILIYSVSGSEYIGSIDSGESRGNKYIRIEVFKVEPNEFKVDGNGTLTLSIKNLVMRRVNVTIYLETHKNVEIYIGNKLLDKVGGNYTFRLTLEPGEKREIPFIVKAKMDIGDYERGYYIKAYIYVGDEKPITSEAIFKVTR